MTWASEAPWGTAGRRGPQTGCLGSRPSFPALGHPSKMNGQFCAFTETIREGCPLGGGLRKEVPI